VVAFHGVRLPLYWCRLASRAPYGSARLLGHLCRWAIDADGRTVRASMTLPGTDPAVFLRITEQRRQMVRGRLLVTTLGTLSLTGAGWVFFISAWRRS
jgi:S-DNA-T family DNA segregation ATPase FtsK/SpoIIIE